METTTTTIIHAPLTPDDSANTSTSTSGTLTPETSDYEASIDSTPNTPSNTPVEDQEEHEQMDPTQLRNAIQKINTNLQAFNESHPIRPANRKREGTRYAENLRTFNQQFPEARRSNRLAEKPTKTYTTGVIPRKKQRKNDHATKQL